jgi:hypothetical protein
MNATLHLDLFDLPGEGEEERAELSVTTAAAGGLSLTLTSLSSAGGKPVPVETYTRAFLDADSVRVLRDMLSVVLANGGRA